MSSHDISMNQGASLVRKISGLKTRAGAAVPDAAAGLTVWFAVRKARGAKPVAPPVTPVHEAGFSLSGYLEVGGLTVELLTPAQSLAIPVGDYYYTVRLADAGGAVDDLFEGHLAMRSGASKLTSAPA